MRRVYFDHNATSPARPEVIAAVTQAMQVHGNASAPHGHGRSARKIAEDGRRTIALAMGVCADDLYFTSGGTEALNSVIYGAKQNGAGHIFVSDLDHPAVISAAQHAGLPVSMIPARPDATSDLDALEDMLKSYEGGGWPLVCQVAVNSEAGTVQDTDQATDLAHDHGGRILIDAVQALGKIPMTFAADYLAVSAHKIGGPMGIGALYMKDDAPFTPLMRGGGQEKRKRAGTSNIAAIAGFAAACDAIEADHSKLAAWRDRIEHELKAIEPDLIIIGETAKRTPNTSFFAVPDKAASLLMMNLDLESISLSTGMACSSGKTQNSRTVLAIGYEDKVPHGALRLSMGWNTTKDDVNTFLTAWAKIRRRQLQGAA